MIDPKRTCCLFGINLTTPLAIGQGLSCEKNSADLVLECVTCPPFVDFSEFTLLYSRVIRKGCDQNKMFLYHKDDCDILQYPELANFYLWSDRILCHPLCVTYDERLINTCLLTTVIPFWLERGGIPILHASAVKTSKGAISFLSHSEQGKSTLAASFVQAGFPLLTDDILPVEATAEGFYGRPGYPWMRMWPNEALYFLGYCDTLERVHPEITKRWVPVGQDGFGSFCNDLQPLRCIYVPERCASETDCLHVEIVPLSPRDAVVELLRYSFIPRIVKAVGLAPQRLTHFTQLAQQVPVRRLIYPSGFDHLSAVREAILEDLACNAV